MTTKAYRPVGHLVVRHPLLPLETLDALCTVSNRSPAERSAFWRDVASRPEVVEALYLASPSLSERLGDWATTGVVNRQVERALVNYLQRMARRCTPFGLFAGISLGVVGHEWRTRLGELEGTVRKTRLDATQLAMLCDSLQARPEIRRTLTFHTNETLYRAGDRLHFIVRSLQSGSLTYNLSAVDALEVLTDALLPAARTPRQFDELSEVARRALADVSASEAEGLIDQLIDAGILVSSLSVPLTGGDGLSWLIQEVASVNGAQNTVALLQGLQETLSQCDAAPTATLDQHRRLRAQLETLDVPRISKAHAQVDVARLGTEVHLPLSVVTQLTRVARLAASATPAPSDPLAEFKTAFSARYEGAEIPLLEALDEAVGIGFTHESAGHLAPLLDLIAFDPAGSGGAPTDPEWDEVITALLARAKMSEHGHVSLRERDLRALARRPEPFAESCALWFSLLSGADGTNEPIASLLQVTGPSSENLHARFASLDERIETKVRDALRAEEALRPEVCFAEVVHAPQGRTGNIVARPTLRNVELRLLASGSLPAAQTLSLDDLVLSIRAGSLELRSRSRRCEVVPRISNSHQAGPFDLPLYRFFAALQFERLSRAPLWSWGSHALAPLLPRVQVGRVVLAPAQWRLPTHDLTEALLAASAQRLPLPRFLTFDGMPVDLQNPLSVERFVRAARALKHVVLHEDLLRRYGSPYSNSRGTFANETVVPLIATHRKWPVHRDRPERSLTQRSPLVVIGCTCEFT